MQNEYLCCRFKNLSNFQKEYKGVLLSISIGILAHFGAAYLLWGINGILLALIFGILVGNLMKLPAEFQSGISFTSSKLLEFSILFLAFSINYTNIAHLGVQSFTLLAVMVLIMLLIGYYLAIKVKCPGATGWLVGFGTTICGSSAIAALAPTVSKNKDDVAISMAVVNLLGSVAMIAMPIVLMKFNLSSKQLGWLIGGTLHSVGNVAGAGYFINNEVGEIALTFKLARVAMLSPALILFNYLVNKKNGQSAKQLFALPWYLWSFIAITILSSFVEFPKVFLEQMESIGKIILIIAMAAIGLKVSFQSLFQSGKRGLLFGLIIFGIQFTIVGLLLFVLK